MTKLSMNDIMPIEEYGQKRNEIRQKLRPFKNARRIAVGPYATVMFEHYDTIWHQVHEMLYVEKGGAEQIAGELEAYNPLMPTSSSITFTLMFEINNPVKRLEFLKSISQVDSHIYLNWGENSLQAHPIDELERTRDDGKTSAVHFLRFDFEVGSKQSFLSYGGDVLFAVRHENYFYVTALSKNLVESLKEGLSGHH
ncbi:MAG: DUF3501 family protein [Alphaproteobacteria bacterium]|nr:DUF3501 family protein [Alphaproteobacteria bacterium]OJV48041.1 MAG: hypothetical protein BGO28_05725 [Alphaproteobacteria bacterium 43-37]